MKVRDRWARAVGWSLLHFVALTPPLTARAQAELPPNLAFGQPVISSGPNWGSFKPGSLTDGDPNTFTHPEAASGTRGFYYQVDLGRFFRLDRIVLRNRADGCCPERLSNFRVELYADSGGEPGALNWGADLRTDSSNSGTAGIDTITAASDPAGAFAGRFIRIVNISDAPYNPQLAEIEAYGGLAPAIRFFAADDDTISAGQNATLRWEIVHATSANLAPDLGPVDAANGSVTVRPAVTTTYTLTAASENGNVSASLAVGVDVTLAPPQLSEFLADNAGNLADQDDESPDWIELKNPNPFSLELGGYFLTDDPANLADWPLPNARIAPSGHLIVFASGKDRRAPNAELHTNFKLDAKGGYLALVDRDGTRILQQFPSDYPTTQAFPKQRLNVSFGFDASGKVGFFRPPTPGTANGTAFDGIVADTQFSIDRGFYDTNLTVAITCATPGAVIRYTTDRSEPTATRGRIYASPIPITNTTVLRAAAFKTGWAPTDVDTHTYVFPANVIASPLMRTSITRDPVYGPQMRAALLDVPSVSLVTTGAFNDTTEVKTSFEWLRPDGEKGIHADCGVRLYGGAFTDFAKKNFRLYFRSEFGASKLKYPLFAGYEHGLAPVDEFDQLELRSGSHDMEMRGFYMSNIFTDDTLLDMGQLNPHGRFVHLYLNGTYWGLFHLRERWGAAMHQGYLGGARTNYESINGNWNVGGWPDPGVPYDGDGSTWTRLKGVRADYAAAKPWLDAPQYVDYMLMWMFGGSEDEYRCVGPTVPGSGFKFYLNDADGWFCIPQYCAAGDRTGRGAPGRAPGDGPGSIFSMLFKEGHPDYRTLLADRIYKSLFNDGALTPARNTARLANRCDEVQRAFLAEAARWGYLTPAAWSSRRDSARNGWFPRRTAEALAQFRRAGFYPSLDAPKLSQQGGLVLAGFEIRFTGPASGTIHFTLDGTDPRLLGGAVSPTAQSYSTGGRNETLIPTGARWRWFTDAVGLGPSDIVESHEKWSPANWKHRDFDDSAWGEGPAQLGYGEDDETTKIPFGGDTQNKWISSYFRHRFTLADIADITSLTLRLKRDDGAIVYLNGREALRSSIPAGTVTGSTTADPAPDDGQTFNTFTPAPDLLRVGVNIVAVEVHQTAPTSSDVSFDLELIATRINSASAGELPVITRNTVLKCRALDGSQWSALNEAFFQVGPSALDPGEVAVTELNFNPPGDDGSEFVELANQSSRTVNLRGARFAEGIDYAFPDNRDTLLAPGQRLVFVNDLFRFQQRYGLDVPVAGVYSGNLDNGGERLTLIDTSSNVITGFTYDGAKPWPTGADGAGYSLVLAHPQLGLDHPAAWRTSSTTNGTPGGTDATLFTGDPLADADADGLPALLEYALGTSDTDPLSGLGTVVAGFDLAGNFAVTFPRNLRADDVLITAEISTDLAAWSPASLLATRTIAVGVAAETWGSSITGRDALFIRLRVVRP